MNYKRTMKNFIKNKTVKSIVFSILFIYGFNYYFFKGNSFGNGSFFNLILLVLCTIVINKNSNAKLKDKKIPFIFSFIISISLIIGNVIYKTNDISTMFNVKDIIFSLIALAGFTKVIGEVIYIVFEKIKNINIASKEQWRIYNKKYFFIIVWALIFISWLPAYLAYYPGSLRYDATWQTEQAMGNVAYIRYHPPIHTFLWQICIDVCSNSALDPLVLYSILQMLFLSFVFAKVVKLLINKKTNNWIILSSILFFALNPAIAVFSYSMTKDVIFAGFLLLFTLQVVSLIDSSEKYLKSPRSWITFCIIALLTCLFRNNAIYVYVLFAIVSVVVLRKYWNKACILLAIPICLYIIVDYGIYTYLGVCKSTSREMFSIPLQQIGRTVHYHKDELDEETTNRINKFIVYENMTEGYNPRHADPVKSGVRINYFENNKKEFFALWFELFKKYPSEYISAFLSLNLPYWYFDATTIDDYSKVDYIEYGIYNNDRYTSKTDSKIPKLKEMYDKVLNFEFAEKKPLIVNIFSITTPFWLSLFTVFILIYKKNYKYILIVLPILLLWLTHMAGPVSNFRYVFAMIIQYPVLLAIIFYNNKEVSK